MIAKTTRLHTILHYFDCATATREEEALAPQPKRQRLLPSDEASGSSDLDDDDDDLALSNEDVWATVYAYCAVGQSRVKADAHPDYDADLHGAPVYVGQTTQTLGERDKQHLTYSSTPFDRAYIDRAQYVLVVLDQRVFPRAEQDREFADATLRPAAEWMDFVEKKFIAQFDTYKSGLNSTAGGQGRGWLVTMREGKAKASNKRFTRVYMPAFRTFHKENGHLNVPRSHAVLGSLMSSIRSGNTAVPPQYEDELRELGFFWCTTNMARHITRMLGRPVASLETDAEAAQAVAQAAAEHARLLELRKRVKGKPALQRAGLLKLPFGTEALGDGVDRFVKDAAQVEK